MLSEFTYKTNWKSISLKLIHVFMPVMLQHATPKSKPHQNYKFLKERLKWRADGDPDSLMKHCRQIQKKLNKKQREQTVNNQKAFCRLMLQGRVRKALNNINHREKLGGGVHSLSTSLINELKLKQVQILAPKILQSC